MKFIIAMAATASALPWEKEVKCGFDAACGFDVVIDEATGCGFDTRDWNYGGDETGSNTSNSNSGCQGCSACKKEGSCGGCTGTCPSGNCESDSGCRNGQCGDAGVSTGDWCIGGVDCEASSDMVCKGRACDDWCPAAAVQCILNKLPDDFSPCCSYEKPRFHKAKEMAWDAIRVCNKHGPNGNLIAYMDKLGIKKDDCCGCYCNFGCNCNCSGKCSGCGCSGCSGNCSVGEGKDSDAIGRTPAGITGKDEFPAEVVNGVPVHSMANAPTQEALILEAIKDGHADRYVKMTPQDKKALAPTFTKSVYDSKKAAWEQKHRTRTWEFQLARGDFSPWDAQCGFDQKSQQWVDVKCGFDNNCGFDFECGFDAECGFDVVKNTKCGFDLVREAAGCGFDTKSEQWVNIQCGFDNNCGFDIKA